MKIRIVKKSCMCMCGVFETWWLFKADPLNLPKFCITPQIDKHFQPHKLRYKNRTVISVKEFFYPLAVCLFVPRSINYKLNFEYNSVVCNIYRILFVVWLSEWVSERTNVKKPILQYQQIDIYIHHLFWKQMTADLGQVPTPTPTHTKRKRTIHWISYLHDRH